MRRLLLKLWRRRRLARELDAEMAFHKEMAARSGNPIPFGNATAVREQALELWRFNFIENFWRDLAYAVRGLRRSPALVFSALLSLALGIGANTAIFSLGLTFLLSEPSVRDASTLLKIRLGGNSHSKTAAVEMLRESGVFQDVAGEYEEGFLNWNDGLQTRRVYAVHTTRNYFTMLGVPMAHGTGYSPASDRWAAVISHDFWRKHLNSDLSIVGRALNLDGRPFTVTGVLPAEHRTLVGFGFAPDIYTPVYLEDAILAITARMKPGMTVEQARAAVTAIATRIDEALPERWKYARNIEIEPVATWQRTVGHSKTRTLAVFFLTLLIVVGLVLLIACVNVASLLLARASARRRETAIRLALGAGRRRLLQQFLVESLALSTAGAALGLALSQAIASALGGLEPPAPVPIRLRVVIDWRTGLYAAFLTMAAAVACGLLPALQSARESIVQNFRREGKPRLRRILVVTQLAVSVVVLCTGTLFIRNLLRSSALDPGFDVTRTIQADINLPSTFSDSRRVQAFQQSALRALEALPGVQAAAAARSIPFRGGATQTATFTLPDTGEQIHARFHWNAVSGRFFEAMGIPLVHGRTFNDPESGGEVAIVNRAFVQRYLKDRAATSVVLLWGAEGKTPHRIIGVVGNTKTFTIGEDEQPQLYSPLASSEAARRQIQFVVRSATPPAAQVEAIRNALRGVEPAAGTEVAPMYSSIGLAFLPSQVGAALLGSLGALGLVLAAIGLYGVMVYMVARRTPEIGVRIAIGAGRGRISAMVLADAARLIGLGAAIGLFAAVFVMKPLAMFLAPGLSPSDPATFLAVAAVLALTGGLASWGPARRAMSVDPVRCLRSE